jgi:tetratricopeptide (TPR) repeat protein
MAQFAPMPGDITAQSFSSRKVCLARAREHIANHAYAAAEQTLKRGAQQWNDFEFDPMWLTVSGHVAWRRERKRQAVLLLRKAASDPEAHVEARFLLGRVLLDCGLFERAIITLKKISDDENQLVPYRAHACSALCVAYAGMGLNKSSQDSIEKAASFALVSAQLLADEGYRLLRVGGFKEAEVQLAKALQIDATCEEAFARLANVLYVQGKLDSALEVLAYAIEQSGEYVPLYKLMGEVHVTRNKHREAAAFFKRGIEISPEGDGIDDLMYLQARALHRAGFSDQAMVCFRDLEQARPRSDWRHESRARAISLSAAKKGGRTRRLENFPRVLQKRSLCAPNTLANVLRYLGRPTQQEDVAARVLRAGSSHWPELSDFAAIQKGVVSRLALGSIELIREMIDKGVPVITSEYHGLSGHMLAIIGYDDAAEVVIAQDPNFIEPVEISFGEFEKGWRHEDRLCLLLVPESKTGLLPPAVDPRKDVARSLVELLRLAHTNSGERVAAEAARLHELAPPLLTPLRVLAEVALQARAAQELRAYCEAALKLQPDCFWAKRHLASVALISASDKNVSAPARAAMLAEAIDRFRKVRRDEPNDQHLLLTLAEILIGTGQKKRGFALLVQALEQDPQNRQCRLRIAQELAETDKEAAIWHARLLVEYDPSDSVAKELFKKLAGEGAVKEIEAVAKAASKPAPAAAAQPAPDGTPASSEDEFEIEVDE